MKTKIKSKRIGKAMMRAVWYVERNPGCVMYSAAIAASPHGSRTRNNALGYDPVHRAIKAGLIRAEANTSRKGSLILYPVG